MNSQQTVLLKFLATLLVAWIVVTQLQNVVVYIMMAPFDPCLYFITENLDACQRSILGNLVS